MARAIDPRLLPHPTPITQPFWDALRIGEVHLQRCGACQRWVFYPRSHCPHCLSDQLAWRRVSGRGRLYSYTINRTPPKVAFAGRTSPILAVVELEEGVRLMTTLLADEAIIQIGMTVQPVFDPVGADLDLVLLKYCPAESSATHITG